MSKARSPGRGTRRTNHQVSVTKLKKMTAVKPSLRKESALFDPAITPLTPGWSRAHPDMFMPPGSPSPFENRRMTRRSSVYVVAGKDRAQKNTPGKISRKAEMFKKPAVRPSKIPQVKQKTGSKVLSPAMTRSRRRASVYITTEVKGFSGSYKAKQVLAEEPVSKMKSSKKNNDRSRSRSKSPLKKTSRSRSHSKEGKSKSPAQSKNNSTRNASPSKATSPKTREKSSPNKADHDSSNSPSTPSPPNKRKSLAQLNSISLAEPVSKKIKVHDQNEKKTPQISVSEKRMKIDSEELTPRITKSATSTKSAISKLSHMGASGTPKSALRIRKATSMTPKNITPLSKQQATTPLMALSPKPKTSKKVTMKTPVAETPTIMTSTAKSAKKSIVKTPFKAAKMLGKSPSPRGDTPVKAAKVLGKFKDDNLPKSTGKSRESKKVVTEENLPLTSTPLKSSKKRPAGPPPVSEIRQAKMTRATNQDESVFSPPKNAGTNVGSLDLDLVAIKESISIDSALLSNDQLNGSGKGNISLEDDRHPWWGWCHIL